MTKALQTQPLPSLQDAKMLQICAGPLPVPPPHPHPGQTKGCSPRCPRWLCRSLFRAPSIPMSPTGATPWSNYLIVLWSTEVLNVCVGVLMHTGTCTSYLLF